MKALPASYAAWYAAERTFRFLFKPFNSSVFLKLATVAVLTEGTLVSFRFTLSSSPETDAPSTSLSTLAHLPGFVFFAVLAGLAAIVLCLLLYYVVIRLRFALFHSLLHQTSTLRPGWNLYRTQTDRLFSGCLLVWSFFVVLLLLFGGVVAAAAFALFNTRTEEGLLDPGNFLFLFFPCAAFALLLLLFATVAEVILHDFILPHMAIEDLSFREAWRTVRRHILANREPFFSYLILRILLPLCAAVVLVPIGLLAGWAVFGVLSASATGFNAMLEDASGFGAVLGSALQFVFMAVAAVTGCLLAAILGGPLGIWLRTYALIFYAGYDRPLGKLIESPPADFISSERS